LTPIISEWRIISILASIIFGCLVYLLGNVDFGGTISTILVLVIISIAAKDALSWTFFTIICYILILIVSRVGYVEKREKFSAVGVEEKKRSAPAILAKLAAPVFAAILSSTGAFIASISFGVSDSFACEVGMLSKKNPRLITSWREVLPGTDGGISLLGTISSIVVPIFIGLIAWCISFRDLSLMALIGFTAFIGIVGSLIDSLFGATLQKRKLANNWQVNAIVSVFCGILGHFMYVAV